MKNNMWLLLCAFVVFCGCEIENVLSVINTPCRTGNVKNDDVCGFTDINKKIQQCIERLNYKNTSPKIEDYLSIDDNSSQDSDVQKYVNVSDFNVSASDFNQCFHYDDTDSSSTDESGSSHLDCIITNCSNKLNRINTCLMKMKRYCDDSSANRVYIGLLGLVNDIQDMINSSSSVAPREMRYIDTCISYLLKCTQYHYKFLIRKFLMKKDKRRRARRRNFVHFHKLKKLQEINEDQYKEIANLHTLNRGLLDACTDYEKEIQEKSKIYGHELKIRQDTIDQYESDNKKIKDDISRLVSQLDACQILLNSNNEYYDNVQKDNNKLKSLCDQMQNQLDHNQSIIYGLQCSNDYLVKKNRELNGVIEQLKDQNVLLQKKSEVLIASQINISNLSVYNKQQENNDSIQYNNNSSVISQHILAHELSVIQNDEQLNQLKLQSDEQLNQLKLQNEQQLKQMESQNEQIKQMKLQNDEQLKQLKSQNDEQINQLKLQNDDLKKQLELKSYISRVQSKVILAIGGFSLASAVFASCFYMKGILWHYYTSLSFAGLIVLSLLYCGGFMYTHRK